MRVSVEVLPLKVIYYALLLSFIILSLFISYVVLFKGTYILTGMTVQMVIVGYSIQVTKNAKDDYYWYKILDIINDDAKQSRSELMIGYTIVTVSLIGLIASLFKGLAKMNLHI